MKELPTHHPYKQFLAILLAASAFACGPSANIRSPGQGSKSSDYERPSGSVALIDDVLLEQLTSTGFPVYEGASPPDISGDYRLDSLVFTFDDGNSAGNRVESYTYSFGSTARNLSIVVSYESDSRSDVANGVGAFVSGDDQCFTVYLDASGEVTGCGTYNAAKLISGCIQPAGIEDYQEALVVTDKEPCDLIVPIGHRRVVDETDGLAQRL